MAMPTTPDNLDKINAAFQSVTHLMADLRSRWVEEKAHENIEDYRKLIQAKLPKPFKIVKAHRSFKFDFTIGTDAVYQLSATNRQVSWRRFS